MPFQALFGDDEHTAAEGPYARLLKSRKWLFLASGLAILFWAGDLNAKGASDVIKFIRIERWLVADALKFSIVYLIFQYTLLLHQFSQTYDIILRERLAFKRIDELQQAEAQAELASNDLDARLKERDRGVGTSEQLRNLDGQIRVATARQVQALERMERVLLDDPARRPGYKFAEIAIDLTRVLIPYATGWYALFRLFRTTV